MNASRIVRRFVAAGLLAAPVARAQPLAPPPDAPLASEPAQTLSLDEAVRAALEYFPTVQEAREQLAGARAAVDEQKAAWFPALRLGASATRYEEPYLVYPIHGFDPAVIPPFDRTVFQGGLAAAYTLFDGGGRGAHVREARGRRDAAAEVLAGSQQELIARVAATYSRVLTDRDVLDAQARRIEALRSERARVRKLREAGAAAEIDSLRVEAELAAAEAARVHLETDLARSERDLSSFTGIIPDRTRAGNLVAVRLADGEVEAVDQAVARAIERNPAVRAALSSAAAAQAAVRAARGAYWPQVSLAGNYQVWSDPDGNSTGEWNAGVQLTQTLFSGGAVKSRVAKSWAASRQAEEALRLSRIQTTRDVQAAHDRVRQASATVRSLRAAAASYAEVARIEALAREVGTGTQTDYLNAEADLVAARARLAEARHAEISARLELARLTSDLTLEWLARHLEVGP